MMAATNQTLSAFSTCGAKFVAFAFICMVYGITLSGASRFLIVLGPDEGSVMFTTMAIGDALIERGQHVTLLVDEIIADQVWRHNPKFDLEMFNSSVTGMEVYELEQQRTAMALTGQGFAWGGSHWSDEMEDGLFYRQCRDLLGQMDVMDRLKESNFDLVLTSLGHICPVLVAKYIDVPFIGLTQSFLPVAHAHAYNQPINSAYMPPAFTGWSDRMSFHQRLLSAVLSILHWPSFLTEPYALPNFNRLKKQYNISPGKSVFRTMDDAELWLIMSHFSLDFPHPMMPNTINVGGLTTKPAKPLDKKFEDFMQSSGDAGVIIFAMGTTTKGVGEEFTELFAKAFAQLPHNVIWKHSGAPPKNVSDNVMMASWLPQNDLLGHPKTRMFIHHCGVNSVFEALYHAVPMVCIPMFGDHYDAAARVVSKHIGIEIGVKSLTSEDVVHAVWTLLEDTSYRDSIQQLSAVFRDESQSPSHRGAYWMEYVVRHGNARHLRSAARDLNFIQYHLLDVIAVFLAILIAVIGLIFYCFKTTCRLCFRVLQFLISSQKLKCD